MWSEIYYDTSVRVEAGLIETMGVLQATWLWPGLMLFTRLITTCSQDPESQSSCSWTNTTLMPMLHTWACWVLCISWRVFSVGFVVIWIVTHPSLIDQWFVVRANLHVMLNFDGFDIFMQYSPEYSHANQIKWANYMYVWIRLFQLQLRVYHIHVQEWRYVQMFWSNRSIPCAQHKKSFTLDILDEKNALVLCAVFFLQSIPERST